MSFNKSVQKIFFMLAISISAVLLCLVGVWAATMNLNFQGKVSPDIHCKIVANESIIFNNSTEMGEQMTSGNTLSTSVTLNAGVTNEVTFTLTNYTPNKYIRLSVASISSTDVISNKDSVSAVCTTYTTTGDDKEGNPDAYATMTLSLTGNSTTDATINLKVEEVYKVTVSGNSLATGSGDHYFSPNDDCNITLEPMVGYQLPTTIIHGGIEGTTYTHTNTGAVVSAQSILKTDATIVANCNQIFEIKKSTAESLGTPNANDDTKPFTIDNKKTYRPNNGHYVYNDGSSTQGKLKSTFVEYPYYVEMGMYPQTEVAKPSGTLTNIYTSQNVTKTITTRVLTEYIAATAEKPAQTKKTTTITTTTTTNTTITTTSSSAISNDWKQEDIVNSTNTTNTTTTTTAIEVSYCDNGTNKYAQVDKTIDGNKTTTYYKFEPIKWIILDTNDVTELSSLTYKNGMLYTDGACGKPYTGGLVLMSAYVLDSSSFENSRNYTRFQGSTISTNMANILAKFSVANDITLENTAGQYAASETIVSQASNQTNGLETDSFSTSFFLIGGKGNVGETSTKESYYAGDYFGINDGTNSSSLEYNVGIASSTAFAAATGVEQGFYTDANLNKIIASTQRAWQIEDGNSNLYSSAYWTRTGKSYNSAIAINMNIAKSEVLTSNSNIGIRPMMVLDLGFYENGTYTA